MSHIEIPIVSIICYAYNHEKYIREALDGFVTQQTNFSFEIVIHDDASTDNTALVIKEYELKFPHLFKPIYQKENQYSKEKGRVTRICYEAAKGKYIALCEGDDYWTDSLKLQKQVDFLENNSHYSFCFHDALQVHEDTSKNFVRIGSRKIDAVVDLKSVIIENNFPTSSLLFHKKFYVLKRDDLSATAKGDYILVLRLVERGLGKYLPEVMSAYRLHEGGVWSSKSKYYKLEEDVKFYDLLYAYFEDSSIRKVIVQKRNKTKQSQSLNAMRSGEFIKGLLGWLAHFNFTADPRLSSSPRKVLSAMKEGFGKL